MKTDKSIDTVVCKVYGISDPGKGFERTVVITYNEALYLGQWQGELVRPRKLPDRLQYIRRQALQGRPPSARGHVPQQRRPVSGCRVRSKSRSPNAVRLSKTRRKR